jgi:hypothetical protein
MLLRDLFHGSKAGETGVCEKDVDSALLPLDLCEKSIKERGPLVWRFVSAYFGAGEDEFFPSVISPYCKNRPR